MNLRDPLFYFLTVALGAIVIASLGPFFDEAHGTHEFLTTVGTFIGGVFTPIAIYTAFRMHRQAIEEPRAEAIKEASAMVNSIIRGSYSVAPSLTVAYVLYYSGVMIRPKTVLSDMENQINQILRHLNSIASDLADHRDYIARLPSRPRSIALELSKNKSPILTGVGGRGARLKQIGKSCGKIERMLNALYLCNQALAVNDATGLDKETIRSLYKALADNRHTFFDMEEVKAAVDSDMGQADYAMFRDNQDDTPS